MSLSDLASLGSFVSGVAVVASLIYLAIQTRQGVKNQRSIMHHGRTEAARERMMEMSRPELGELMWRVATGDASLSDAEWLRYYFHAYGNVYSYEDSFYQHRSGMFGETEFTSLKKQLAFQFSLPYFRASWQIMRSNFETQFVEFMDAEMKKTAPARRNIAVTLRSLVDKEMEVAGGNR